MLVEVKGRVGHGKYENFIRERLRFSLQAALNYVRTYQLLKSTTGVDLKALQIDARSLYLLGQPSTPEEARAEALEKAASPNGISHDEVAALVEQARRQAASKATAEAQRQGAAQLAKAAKETEAAIAKLTKAETKSADLAAKLVQLFFAEDQLVLELVGDLGTRPGQLLGPGGPQFCERISS
jgi:hypothetical protein